MRQYEQREQDLSQVLHNITAKLPQCNLEPELPVTQKVRRIAEREKALEEEKAKLEEDYKAQIAELKARVPDTSEADKEARTQAFKIVATQMKCRIDDVESLLADVKRTWSELEELPDKLDLQQSIQNYEKTIAQMEEEAKSLGALAKMKKKTELNQLQQQVQKL